MLTVTAEALRARSAPGKKNGKLPRSTRGDIGEVVPGKYNGWIVAAAALESRLVCSRRHAKEGGKNKRRANGEGIYKRVGKKGGVYIGRGKS